MILWVRRSVKESKIYPLNYLVRKHKFNISTGRLCVQYDAWKVLGTDRIANSTVLLANSKEGIHANSNGDTLKKTRRIFLDPFNDTNKPNAAFLGTYCGLSSCRPFMLSSFSLSLFDFPPIKIHLITNKMMRCWEICLNAVVLFFHLISSRYLFPLLPIAFRFKITEIVVCIFRILFLGQR